MAIHKIQAKTLLSKSKRPDPWFGCLYNMNIYRGCEHQCIYCNSRSECYQIENFADVLVKINAVERIQDELPRKRTKGTICFGAMSDTYTKSEQKFRLTRGCLEVIAKHKFPIHIVTKSNCVVRDIDLLKKISEVYAAISFTITTTDDELAKKLEPGAPLPSQRLDAMKQLADAGIYTGVTLMPVLPFIEDNKENIYDIVEKSAAAGAQYFIPGFGVTLRDRQRKYFYDKLDVHFPGVAERYRKTFGNKYSAASPHTKKLWISFQKLAQDHNIPTKISVFQPERTDRQVKMGI